MRRTLSLPCAVLAVLLLTPVRSSCTSIALTPPSADLVRSGEIVVVAYEDNAGVRVQANSVTDGHLIWRIQVPARFLVTSGLCESGGLVYVPTGDEGVYVLNAGTGSVRARLRPRNPVLADLPTRGLPPEGARPFAEPFVACAADRALVGYGGENWLVAYNTRDFRPVWRRVFRDLHIDEVGAKGNEFTALALNQSGGNRWERVVLRSDDGKTVARRPAVEPGHVVPEGLPKAVKEWFFKTVGGLFGRGGRFSFEHNGNLWFVGVPADLESTGAIYAVRSNGRVVWTKHVPGLSAVVLVGDRLVGVARRDDGKSDAGSVFGDLFALDANSGRQLWNVGLSSQNSVRRISRLQLDWEG